jgi:hypothetical protein
VSAAYETITCASALHTVTLGINTVGFGSGEYGGPMLFPYELQKPADLMGSFLALAG